MHFIQREQFCETNVTSHDFQHFQIWSFFLMLPRATDNAVVGHMQARGPVVGPHWIRL